MHKIELHNPILPVKMASLMLAFALIFGCQGEGQSMPDVHPKDFPNVLDVRNIPMSFDDWESYCHSDQGAWFGFGLPPLGDAQMVGAITGPFLMTHGGWLSPAILKLELVNGTTGHTINLSEAQNVELIYYPGRLEQSFQVENLKVILELIFADSSNALARVRVDNTADSVFDVSIGWTGSVFPESEPIDIDGQSAMISLGGDEYFMLRFPTSPSSITSTLGSTYKTQFTSSIQLRAGEIFETYVNLSLGSNEPSVPVLTPEAIDEKFQANSIRWTKYLNAALGSKAPWREAREYREVAVKSLMTLLNNWRSARGDLHHGGLFPSYAVWYFNGFWAWDSWKHSVALATFAPQIAKNQVRAMFDWQDETGMVPDVIYADKSENNNRDTKPPLAAWAVWSIYEADQDADFLAEMYPLLKKYHEWWFINRDVNNNGICEYGSTDGTLEAARWESGMDNAIRFDSTMMLQTSETAWSMDQESVDLNAFLFAEKLYLTKIAATLQKPNDEQRWEHEARVLQKLVQSRMFDSNDGFFHDIRIDDGASITPMGPEGWIPLWAGVASAEQANEVLATMRDTSKFATFVPFPTVAIDSPEFSKGYWRGPVWLDQVYFAISAFHNYGYEDEAREYTQQVFRHAEDLMGSRAPIRENYWPLDGKGMLVNHFSWSAAHILLLYQGLD